MELGTLATRDATLPAEYSARLEAPPWHWVSHGNASATAPACLFHLNDEPALRALGLWQEETRA
jgi:gentisate 1,2-dioxygenase